MTYLSHFLYLSLLILIHSPSATADESGTSNESPYTEELKCYGLPYGGAGFASHILTYYATIMLCLGKDLSSRGKIRGKMDRVGTPALLLSSSFLHPYLQSTLWSLVAMPSE